MSPDDERVVKEAAKEAVNAVLERFGIDTDNPIEVQADMAHLHRTRIASEQMGVRVKFVLIGVLVVGGLSALWIGIKAAIVP